MFRPPPVTTRVYAADGQLIGEFSDQNRIFVPIQQVPERVIRAFTAAEAFDGELQVLRPAPRRPHRIGLATWMALARAAPEPSSAGDSPAQDLF